MIKNFPYSSADLREAVPDYLALRMGVGSGNLHPIAERLIDEAATLKDLAVSFYHAAGRSRSASIGQDLPLGQVVSLGMGTHDFGQALANSVRQVIMFNYETIAQGHRAICNPIPAKDFKKITFPLVDGSDDATLRSEGAEIEVTALDVKDGPTASLATWTKRFLLTREAVINDDIKLLEAAFAQAGASLARTEARQVYGLLESNPVLPDGSQMFDALLGNLVTGTMNASGLGAAMGAVRNQKTPAGNVSNNDPKIMLVPSDAEVDALALVKSISVDKARLQVVASPWLSSGAWYLLADPSVTSALGLLYLEGRDVANTVQIATTKPRIDQDGLPIEAWSDFAVAALGRIGIVKVAT